MEQKKARFAKLIPSYTRGDIDDLTKYTVDEVLLKR